MYCDRYFMCHNDKKYVETTSDSLDNWNLIPKPNKRIQLLHHCYNYGTNEILLAVGTRKKLKSGVKINMFDELMNAYDRLISRLYFLIIQKYYECDPNSE